MFLGSVPLEKLCVLAPWPGYFKKLPKVKILKFHFLNWNIIIFDALILKNVILIMS